MWLTPICSDEMGLGKTIQIITIIVLNPRGSRYQKEPIDGNERSTRGAKSGFSKTTLVVAPASLLRQWKEEIDTKCQDGLLRVHIHHGKDKIKSVKELRAYDVSFILSV